MSRIGVIGAGAWGTALALIAAEAGHDVVLWGRDAAMMAAIAARRANDRYLPGIALPATIRVTAMLADCSASDALLLAVPAQALRGMLVDLCASLPRGVPVILCAKGIEKVTGLFPSEVLAQILPGHETLILSGPSFAHDVARSLPTAVTLGAQSLESAMSWAQALSLPHFRIYPSADPRGVEIGGAVKNVLAIACGIAEGKGLGDSTRAALTTRAFAELTRFGKALGARPQTLTGLSGLGDLLLTCSSRQSRNFAFGIALGEGKRLDDALAAARGTVEGLHTAAAVHALALQHGLDMPISAAVQAIITGSPSDEEIARLLARPLRAEFGGA
ncbi:NAD(P)H-dependent glycerol-3-phosphate dehydrogenase [soil metagenome]